MNKRDRERPTVPEVLPLVLAYYAKPGNGAGGCLHIVLDDDNVDDDSVRFCIDYAAECGDEDGVYLAQVLLHMSRTQRLKLCGLIVYQARQKDEPIPRLPVEVT